MRRSKMRKKGLAYLLTAAMIIGTAGFSGGTTVRADEPGVVQEDDSNVTQADETGEEESSEEIQVYEASPDVPDQQVDSEKEETVSDETQVSDESEDAEEVDSLEDEDRATDSKWIKEYEYELSGNNVILMKYIGESENITVRKKAIIGGKTYYTKLKEVTFDDGYDSIWGEYYGSGSMNGLKSIAFEDGFVFPEKCSMLFAYNWGVEKIDLSGVDTSNVTDMTGMFLLCTELETPDFSNFNTKNVESMELMFYNCGSMRNIDLSSFDTSSLVDVSGMFMFCYGATSINLSSFDLKNVGQNGHEITNISTMFQGCEAMELLYTPKNLKYDVPLPYLMFDPKGNQFTYLPKNVSNTKKLETNFTGWSCYDNVWNYFVNSEVTDNDVTLLGQGYISNKKNWYASTHGCYNTEFTGIAKFDGKAGWGFAKNGVHDTSFSGLALATNGHWYYVNKGIMDKSFDGKIAQTTDGKWYYVSKGCPTKKFTGKIAETTDGRWYYCTDGRPDLKFSGKIAQCTNSNWYYVTNGKIDRSFTGIATATNGKKYYVEKGVLNKNFTGTYTYKGKTYTIVKGAVK
jgi:surface protein